MLQAVARSLDIHEPDYVAGHRWVACYEGEPGEPAEHHAQYRAYGATREQALERLEETR